MDPIPPVITAALRPLRDDLFNHLDRPDELALLGDEWTEQQDADTDLELILALVNVIRALVIEHYVTLYGDCRICRSGWPCPVVTTIHALIKDPDRELPARLCCHNDA